MNTPPEAQPFAFEPLSRRHERHTFTSGRAPVDLFLRQRALQAQTKRLSATTVLVHPGQAAILGYFTLAMGQVDFGQLPPALVHQLPRRELPVAVLAWLGVHREQQGRGLGTRLLAAALRRCWEASQTFPFVAVILDCVDEAARDFYLRWDFRPVPGRPLRLFLSMAELDAMMRGPA